MRDWLPARWNMVVWNGSGSLAVGGHVEATAVRLGYRLLCVWRRSANEGGVSNAEEGGGGFLGAVCPSRG